MASMTAVSLPPATFTPPASSHGKKNNERGDWEYSVPIDEGERTDLFQGRQTHGFSSVASPVKSDPNGYTHANGYYPQSENLEYDDRTVGQTGDYGEYLAAPRAPLLSKHDSIVSSNHDDDSLFDLYGGRMSVVSNVNDDASGFNSRSGSSTPHMNANGSVPRIPDTILSGSPEGSKWIHRDKLAQIEGNEAVDYLYDVGQSRWIHKDKLERIEIEELQRAGEDGQHLRAASRMRGSDDQKQLRVSPPPGSDDGEASSIDFHDIRTLEEQAAAAADTSTQAMSRKDFRRNASYSRIPLASISPHPIPQQFIERTTPLPRTSVTPNGSDDGGATISPPSIRKRSYSAGSAMLLDDRENLPVGVAGTPTPSATSVKNPKTRNITSPARRNGSRTGSMKQRTRSNPQLSHRSGASTSHMSHGSGSTPGSATRNPEGQPPWALASYQPDPSLPPDQQIIPTLARRLQQDQWERDGVYASVYDRELRPLKVDNGNDGEKNTANKFNNVPELSEDWPLKSSAPLESEPKQKPEQSDGGYRTVPSIHRQSAQDASRPVPQIKQMPSTDDDEAKKKKFCCCVVM